MRMKGEPQRSPFSVNVLPEIQRMGARAGAGALTVGQLVLVHAERSGQLWPPEVGCGLGAGLVGYTLTAESPGNTPKDSIRNAECRSRGLQAGSATS